MKNSICLICLIPRKVWLDFLSSITHYSVFIAVDDNYYDYIEKFKCDYTKLTFIQIKDDRHIRANFRDVEHPYTSLSNWHKALYYFSVENLEHDNVWFIEDDVFFYNENTIRMIDYQYADSDYLSNVVTEYDSVTESELWLNTTVQYDLPWYCANVSAVRLSRTLLQNICEYAQKNETLFVIDAMLPTIAHKNGLRCDCPKEMVNIRERDTIDLNTIRHDMLYHPMKYNEIYPSMRQFITDVFFKTPRK